MFFTFVFLIKLFKYHNNMKKGVKYMIIKLLFLLLISITLVITFVLSFADFSNFFFAFNNKFGTLFFIVNISCIIEPSSGYLVL